MCPILSLASLSVQKSESRIVALGVPQPDRREPEATACQGPRCSWFVPIADEKGQVLAGGCAMALVPTALSGILNVGAALVQMQAPKAQSHNRPYPIGKK